MVMVATAMIRSATSRSVLIGVFATCVDLLMLLLLVSALGVPPVHANVPALVAGLVVQFVGNKYWAFRDPSPALARQLAWFSLVEVVALALNAAIFHGLVAGLGAPPLIARGVGSAAVYVGFSLPWWRRIFRGGRTPRTSGGR